MKILLPLPVVLTFCSFGYSQTLVGRVEAPLAPPALTRISATPSSSVGYLAAPLEAQALSPLPELAAAPLSVDPAPAEQAAAMAAPAASEEAPVAGVAASVDLEPVHAAAAARLSSPAFDFEKLFDGSAKKTEANFSAPRAGAPFAPDEWLARLRESVAPGGSVEAGIVAWQTIGWLGDYVDQGRYKSWALAHQAEISALAAQVNAAISSEISVMVWNHEFEPARLRLRALTKKYRVWAAANEALLSELQSMLPAADEKAETVLPEDSPEKIDLWMRKHMEAGEYRQAEYLLNYLEKSGWAEGRAEEIAAAHKSILEGIYRKFEEKKKTDSPLEAKRLSEFAQALAEGKNRGFGFKQPAKQDPQSPLCTIYSLYNAFEATIGFVDPAMNLEKFTELVRTALGDPKLGITYGLSTHRVRLLMKALGYQLKVVEMQRRVAHPFQEEELIRLIRSDRIVIPVFIIAQYYPDTQGLLREEHKGFIRDAFYSPTEKRMIYMMMDPLIGRTSFYTWPEMKVFLHKLFVVKLQKPLS